uniref:Cytochrome b6-f complex subunit PetP n=2 Tax=Grateloupia TaxID=31454 RepID=A0A6F8UMK9_9FLOR|nr:hypothetical protein Grafi_p162 [Grateloupia filicina]AWD77428.1 hypothetical protein Grafi_p162 [Grateloupia filicina]BCB15041.1 hypothetical protein [Grateloupia asiatica]
MSRNKTYIRELNSNINIGILKHLYNNGIIVGTKILSQNDTVIIIELNDYTRIWMLPEELNINEMIQKNYNSTRTY